MSRQCYAKLIEEFCKLTGLSDPVAIMRGGLIEVNDIDFSLIHSEKIDPDLLFIYCEFGDPPPGRDKDVYRALLKQNFFLYKGNAPVFTISPDSGRVMMAQYVRLVELTPEALLFRLNQLSDRAKDWLEDPFFSEEITSPISRHKNASTFLAESHRKISRSI